MRPNAGKKTRPLVLLGIALAGLVLASTAIAVESPSTWERAAARVDFPLYRPTVTLGFARGPVVVERCGSSGNTWARASYSKGKAVFGFDQSYPQHCGDAGERMTVTTADVNGDVVNVQVYCYSPGPKCTVADGFANGFHIELRGAGPKRTMIGAYSHRVSLPDMLRMLRSLTRVPRASTAAPGAPAAAGPCSKAEATRVVRRLGIGDGTLPQPVYAVLCGAFTGPGSQAMAVSLATGGTSVPFGGWAVFRRSGGGWQLVMQQPNGARISAAGSGIRETVGISRPGDPRCCPSGGERSRVWRWNGSRLVAGEWTQESSRQPQRRAFYSPSRNLFCDIAPGGVTCTSRTPPHVVSMGLDAKLTICRGVGCIGNPGETDPQPTPTLLAYGRQITVGGFRCLSLETGVRCTVIQTGKGFQINRDGVSRIGR